MHMLYSLWHQFHDALIVAPAHKREHNLLTVLAFQDLPEDVLLVLFSFIEFPLLCRIKPVCQRWMARVDRAIVIRQQNSKAFTSHPELIAAVHKYYYDKVKHAEILARTYGWPIGKWDVSRVTNFTDVFERMSMFNEDIGDWDVSRATTFHCMFDGASSFDQDLSKWNTSNAQDMTGMFCHASSFNGNVSTWDTKQVKIMLAMFNGASSFNRDLSLWQTSNVTDMKYMFQNATEFCHTIAVWDVSQVEQREGMFRGATSFRMELAPRLFRNAIP
eukprot:CAMPEP_0178906524 /NCGR_PEP_ID=MMETSP0786-20121207/6876_1 /TAXON_ID=186022 /ORGANISM="Thalassionema frauenfeldii, Strain CCMP 1798" /LENGTH=273 /DNA_ID=CAMNT_0020578247 /DNA_START=152 /DNA_END=973 /DNA_ORIENTATION=+